MITPPTVGQRSQLRVVIVKTYLNENGYAVSGKCKRACNTLIPFLVFLFIVTFITACAQPSAIIVTLRWGQRPTSWVGYVLRVARAHVPGPGSNAQRKTRFDCAGKALRGLPGELRRSEFSHVERERLSTLRPPGLAFVRWVLFLRFSVTSFEWLGFLKILPKKVPFQELVASTLFATRSLAPEEAGSHFGEVAKSCIQRKILSPTLEIVAPPGPLTAYAGPAVRNASFTNFTIV